MFKDNLFRLRKLKHLTQEELAEKLGVTRQAVAKWEAGDSMPDLEKSRLLAETLEVSLDELANDVPGSDFDLGLTPRGKHLFGVVTVGEKGQIVIPARARRLFAITPGDRLVVLGDEAQGLALLKAEDFLTLAAKIRDAMEG